MTSVASPLPHLYPGQRHPAGLKLTLAVSLVALADWLFYDQREGISVVVFAVALMCGSLAANYDGLDRSRALPAAAVIFLAGLLPAAEDLNAISFVLLVLALVGLRYVDEANLSAGWKPIARSFIPLAAILMPAGFFLSMVSPSATAPNSLIALTYVGAVVLAIGVVTLGVGLLRPDPR